MKMEQVRRQEQDSEASSSIANGTMQGSLYEQSLDGEDKTLVKTEPNSAMEGAVIEGIKIKEEFIPEEQEAEESPSFISPIGADRIKQEVEDIETPSIEATSVTSPANLDAFKSNLQHAGTNFETHAHFSDKLNPWAEPPQEYSIAQESIIVKEEVVFTQENSPFHSLSSENSFAGTGSEAKTECHPQENSDECSTSHFEDVPVSQAVISENFNPCSPHFEASAVSNKISLMKSESVEDGNKFVHHDIIGNKMNRSCDASNFSLSHSNTKDWDLPPSTIKENYEEHTKVPRELEKFVINSIQNMEKGVWQKLYYHNIESYQGRELKKKCRIVIPLADFPRISSDVQFSPQNEISLELHPNTSPKPCSNSVFFNEKLEMGKKIRNLTYPRKSEITKTTPRILRKSFSGNSFPSSKLFSASSSSNCVLTAKSKLTKGIPNILPEPISSCPVSSEPTSPQMSTNCSLSQKSNFSLNCDASAESESSLSSSKSCDKIHSYDPELNCTLPQTNNTSSALPYTDSKQALCWLESSNSSFLSKDENDFSCSPQSDLTTKHTLNFTLSASNTSSTTYLTRDPLCEPRLASTVNHFLGSTLTASESLSIINDDRTAACKPQRDPKTGLNPNATPPVPSSTSLSRRKSALVCKQDSEPTLICFFSDFSDHRNRPFNPKRKSRQRIINELLARENIPQRLSVAEANKWISLDFLTCKRCGTSFKTVKSCLKHVRYHFWDTYSCKSCPLSFRCRNLYEEHLKTHACSKFLCHSCHESFWSLRAYTAHSKKSCSRP